MMGKSVIFVLALVYSVQSKVVLNKVKLPDVTDNLIHNDPPVHIKLPIVKQILSKIIPPNKVIVENIQNKENITLKVQTVKEKTQNCNSSHKNEILDNIIDSDEREPCEVPEPIDNGTALILTSYIEKGELQEVRNASRVNPDIFLGFESYSGFLTVNKAYDSNLFFWYFPVEKKPVNETPLIIWLQGGPGASSLTGLFDEIGPFKFNPAEGVLKKNPHTWLQNHSLIFIDNPVGTGYSFTKHEDGYSSDMASYGGNLYKALHQILQVFPELKSSPLYVAGESYAGKYVPALAMEIHEHKSEFDINLQGLIIGNAYIDPQMISNISHSFYYFGLVNKEQLEVVDPLLKAFQRDIAANNSIAAKEKWNSIITILLILTHQKHGYNFLKDDLGVGHYINFLKKSEVKRALHVGDIRFSFVNFTVNVKMSPDFLSSSKQLYERLLEDYRVLAYCGQLDQMLPCVFTTENYRTWKWNGTSEFIQAARHPYIFNSKLAGYHKTGGHLTEVVVRGAGHMVPVDEPAPIQYLVTRWTHNRTLSRRIGILEGSFIQEYVKNHSNTIYL